MTKGSAPQDFLWDDLKIVLAVDRSQSFSGAASLLGTSQSTVSRRVALLEDDLGVRLFERTLEGVVATAAAKKILEDAKKMERIALGISRNVAGTDERCAGTVRVALPETIALYSVIPHLPKLREKYPDLRIELMPSTAVVDLMRNEADIALRFVKPEQGDLVATKIATLTMGIFAAATSAWVSQPLAAAEWISWDAEHDHLPEAQWLRHHFPDVVPVLRVPTLVGIAQAIRTGIGVGLLPHSLAGVVGGCTELPPPAAGPHHALWLVSHRETRSVARIRAVRAFLKDVCSLLNAEPSPQNVME